MKLMLVEDEKVTIEGLLQSIPWREIGIDDIVFATDGAAGVEVARKESPQIVLCDIRMPRMDGLTMISHIMKFNPNIVSIVLSGYAEIEYLKKAIHLNVINFIEKPFDLDELLDALHKAVDQSAKLALQKQSAEIHSSVVASRLAYQLTFPYDNNEDIVNDLYKEFLQHYGTDKFRFITTFVVRPEHFPANSLLLYSIGQQLHDHLLPGHYHVIYTDKIQQDIIYHIYGSQEPATSTLHMIGGRILSYYSDNTRSYIAIGETVRGIRRASRSYQTAMKVMSRARFYEPDSILDSNILLSEQNDSGQFDIKQETGRLQEDYPSRFYDALHGNNDKSASLIINELRNYWYHSNCKDSQVKTIYYSMFTTINQVFHDLHILTDYTLDTPGIIIDMLDSAFSFSEIHAVLCEKTEDFFTQLCNNHSEDPVIYRIRTYITDNYSDPSLSVKTISENVFLSVSYLCTYFKNETGITLNQYITDYRMKKAIQFLTETNMKIVDIANIVGYRDSNYFAKLFKKQTGYSPKEYKKRMNG